MNIVNKNGIVQITYGTFKPVVSKNTSTKYYPKLSTKYPTKYSTKYPKLYYVGKDGEKEVNVFDTVFSYDVK